MDGLISNLGRFSRHYVKFIMLSLKHYLLKMKCESSRAKMALLILIHWVIKHYVDLGLCPAQTK